MSHQHITSKQRTELSVLLRVGHNQSEIARLLGKHRSSISRELKRNSANNTIGYHAQIAKQKTKGRRIAANQRFRKIENNTKLRKYIIRKLRKYWSPEQIAGRLKEKQRYTIICHETIYQFIYTERPDLKRYLRCQKGKYRKRYGTKKREIKRENDKKKRIDVRPEIVEQRKRLGDWEGDFIIGQEKTTGILTHVDRKSGYLTADKVEKLEAQPVKEIIINRLRKLPRIKRKTITYDNDKVLTTQDMIERKTGVEVYFAYPYHSWERGTNENTNGLLRQFFPKKTPFANITQEEINKKVRLINARPRKRLHYLTPAEVFNDCCALD